MNHRKIFYQAVIPSMLAFALSGIYSVADGFFVGNSLGDNALAAINIAYPLTAFIQAAGTGIGMGGAVMFAIHNGSGDYSRSRKFFGISLLLLALSGFLFTLFFLGNGERILRMFGAEGDILRLGAEYFRYIAFGTLFQVMATGIVPFIRNMGSPVTAMFAMTGGFLTNILLDYILVWVLPYGMTGAAVATVIGQAVTLAVCLIFLMRKRELPSLSLIKKRCTWPEKSFLWQYRHSGSLFHLILPLSSLTKAPYIMEGIRRWPVTLPSAIYPLLSFCCCRVSVTEVSRSSAFAMEKKKSGRRHPIGIWPIALPLPYPPPVCWSSFSAGSMPPLCSGPPAR